MDNNWQLLSYVPFADHNAMLDPTCPDITGRVLEALCALRRSDRAIRPCGAASSTCARPRSRTEAGTGAGAWTTSTGRSWRCAACARPARATARRTILRAGEWLRSIQNADGGWGESCASYDNGRFSAGREHRLADRLGPPGPAGRRRLRQPSVQQGIEYLLETQRADGTWDEELATGTGFPRVFYLTYHLYRHSFPLLALATFLKARAPDTRAERGYEFPLSMTAGMAGYIVKNKLRPRPEWQRTWPANDGARNPFRILHAQAGNGSSRIR